MHSCLSVEAAVTHRRCEPETLVARQDGQIAPVALFGILIASAVLALMFNASQKVTARSLVANAADAAAYSGAVWTARHLNFMAYTNRAMIANHAAVGHFVSYVSWIRYIDDSVTYMDRVAQWIPYIGQYVDFVEQVAGEVRDATERAAHVAVPAIDEWNAIFRAAQLETQASLASGHLQDLMARTASAYDPAIRVNDDADLGTMPPELRAMLEAQLIAQLATVPAFIQRYAAGADRNSLQELVGVSLQGNADLKHWISGERGWRENLLAAQIRKRGWSTSMQGSSNADWKASDDLQHRRRDVAGWKRWQRIGDQTSTASASEFASDYAGVPAYYNLAGAPGSHALSIFALATLRQARVATTALSGMSADAYPIVVAAVARVEFRRPDAGAFTKLTGKRQEYANLFNPFWEAHLAPIESALEHQ